MWPIVCHCQPASLQVSLVRENRLFTFPKHNFDWSQLYVSEVSYKLCEETDRFRLGKIDFLAAEIPIKSGSTRDVGVTHAPNWKNTAKWCD